MSKKSFVDNIIRTIFMMQRLIMKEESRSDLSFFKKVVLHYILENKNPTMKEMSQYLQVTMPSTTSIIDDLVSRGLVKRILDKKDRRLIRISMTKKGLDSAKRGLKEMESSMRKNFSVLTLEDQKKFFEIIKKIYNNTKNNYLKK